jgi:hypothetical protein
MVQIIGLFRVFFIRKLCMTVNSQKYQINSQDLTNQFRDYFILLFYYQKAIFMNIEEIKKTKFFKFSLPIFIAWAVISIFKAGYATGQWLFEITH